MQITPLQKFSVPLGGQAIELQDILHDAGGMRLLRIRIRERTRFTIFDIDAGTARQWGAAMQRWADAQAPAVARSGAPDGAATLDGEMPVPESDASVVDVAFDVEGTSLPADHAWPLLRAVEARLPWFAGEPLAGIHPLRTVPTAYGVVLARAARQARAAAAGGATAGCPASAGRRASTSAAARSRIGAGAARTLRPSATLSAHRVATDAGDDAAFEADVANARCSGWASTAASSRGDAGRGTPANGKSPGSR